MLEILRGWACAAARPARPAQPLRQWVSQLPQGPCHGDERQTDQRGGVLADNACEQAYAQALAAKAAGAVEGLFGVDIAVDFGIAERAKVHGGGIHELQGLPALDLQYRHGGVKRRGGGRQPVQLFAAALGVAGLLEQLTLASVS